MDREFSDFISNVLDKTDIVSLISRYVKVERKGNTYWACCPFHNETQPSFSISDAKQFFHCFGCKESGNAISFLMKMENIEFIDALKILAEQAGLEMPKPKGGQFKKTDKKLRETLYNLMRDAARHYHDNLSNPRAKIFNDYLSERKITPNMVTRFGLGASLDFTEMLDYLKSKGYTYEQMHAAGIAEEKDGRQYDVFGKRLIYPIIDNLNQVVAFGGRTLEKDVNFAKYRNSSQTEIFDKSKVIYGVNLLKKRKAQKPIDYVIMVEGYMDVIALHKAGFDTAVASMGTALTSKQARQLKIYSDLVYISYDGDTAGQKATMRGLDILRESGLTVKVVRLPQGLDPDDVIKQGGAEAYNKLLAQAVPLTAHKLEVLRAKYDIDDPDQRARYAIDAARAVAALDNPIEQEQYLAYVSDRTGFSVDALKRQINFNQTVAQQQSPNQQQERETQQPKVEYDEMLKFFLSSIIQAYDYVDYDKNVTGAMPDEFTKRLYTFCRENRVKNLPALIASEFDDETESSVLNELYNYKPKPGDMRAMFADVQTKLYCRMLDAESKALNEQYKLTKDSGIKEKLGEIFAELAKYRTRKQ